MTTTQTADVAEILAARKQALATPPQTEYPDQAPAAVAEVIPPADSRTGEIVPASTAGVSPPTPSPSPPSGTAVEPARPLSPPDYSMIPAKVLGGIPYASEYARLAKTICNTEMVPAGFRGAWDKVMAAFMKGYEMGLGPMQALDSFNVIEGKVGLAAEAMRALIINAGHQIILEEVMGNDGKVTGIRADCRRSDWPEGQWRAYSFSMEDALVAGLLVAPRSGRAGAWQKYPRAMLEARATSGAGRRYFPDVLAGMSYTPEEIRDFDGPQEEVTPSPAPATPPPPASVPETSSAESPAPALAVDSTGTASATSSAEPASSAPPTSSPPAKKPRASTKKAAPKEAAPSTTRTAPATAPPTSAADASPPTSPAASTAAPNAPAPEVSTPPAAVGSPSDPKESPAGDSLATAIAPESAGEPDVRTAVGNGEAGVLAAMRGALAEIIVGQPAPQQPLLRSFLLAHWPQGASEIRTEAELQKAIDIAVGWPLSAEQHPPPEKPGEMKWQGYATRVVLVDGELEARCDRCEWRLPQAETQKNLPEFRQIELAAATAISHEQDAYADGTPYCPARPVQPELAG